VNEVRLDQRREVLAPEPVAQLTRIEPELGDIEHL